MRSLLVALAGTGMAALPVAVFAPSPAVATVPACGCHAHQVFALMQPQSGDAPKVLHPSQQPDHERVDAKPREVNLRNVKKMTFGGQNAEAYWNVDGDRITYQARVPGYPDEQIFQMNADGSEKRLVSTGEGRCTCSYFSPDDSHIYFSSTHTREKGAQPPIDMSQGYVWMVNPNFSLYRRNLATGTLDSVIDTGTYVAEATIAPDGSFLTFTGLQDGELDIYRSNLEGGDIRRLTNSAGYDGGPFVGWCSSKIVYRRDSDSSPEYLAEYRRLLDQFKVRPGRLEIWVMDADGSNKRQVTNLGGASFAPFLHPDGKRILFSSNFEDPRGRVFDLYMVNIDGTGLRRITFHQEFDSFPMFNKEGTKLLWSSNRYNWVPRETNVFVADWVEVDREPVELEPTDDVWVYSFAGPQDRDPILRVWGDGATSLPDAEDTDTELSYSMLKFQLPDGDLSQFSGAELVLYAVPGQDYSAKQFLDYPIEAFLAPTGWNEKSWNFDLAPKFMPTKTFLGRNAPVTISEEPFAVIIPIMLSRLEESKSVKSDRTVAIAIGSKLPVDSFGREGVYRLFGRHAEPNLRPKLRLLP
ncbi:MAG: TolB family protein [Fimbriimonadaceae bacterium]